MNGKCAPPQTLRLAAAWPPINYASGTLRLPLVRFLASTTLALAVKTLVYSSAIHQLLELALARLRTG